MKVVFSDFELFWDGYIGRYNRYRDTLSFYDGISSMSNLHGTYTNVTKHPDVIYSSGQFLYVKFHTGFLLTDSSRRLFKFSFSAVKKGTETVVFPLVCVCVRWFQSFSADTTEELDNACNMWMLMRGNVPRTVASWTKFLISN